MTPVAPLSVPASVPEKRHSSMLAPLTRIVAMRKAVEMIGQGRMARSLGVADRTMRAYLGAERELSAEKLVQGAVALEIRADELIRQAVRLREVADAAVQAEIAALKARRG